MEAKFQLQMKISFIILQVTATTFWMLELISKIKHFREG